MTYPTRYCHKLAILAMVSLIAGCASSPWLKVALDNPDYEDAAMTEDEHTRAAFFGRYLAEENTRSEIESAILETEYVHKWTTAEKSTNASMAGDAIAGEISSDLGLTLGVTTMMLGILSGDGSMDYVSQAFLPAEVNGKTITNAKEAKIAANTLIRGRLKKASDLLGADLNCVQGCDQRSDSVFTMQLPAESPSSAFIYWPSDLVITVDVGGATAVGSNSVLPELLGFPIAWKTLPGNSAEIRIYSEGEYTTKGELKYEPNPGNRKIDPMVKYKMEGTALGAAIMKTIYEEERLIWGTQEEAPGMLFLDGKVYGFVGNGRPDFVSYNVRIPSLEQLIN
jgi:hypothetical protein